MRKEYNDNYTNFALLGNDIYDIHFMNYLFESQNVNSYYCDKYKICDDDQENVLKNIAYYFGTEGPILIDDKELKKILDDVKKQKILNMPNLSSEDIINQIDVCLKCDAVYVCNSNGKLDKFTVFILGYLMAKKQEIFFWNYIDESEWLMSCISKKNNNGYKEVVQFPLEIIRSFAYPYLFKKEKLKLKPGEYGGVIIVDDEGNIGVDRNTEFNLQVENYESEKNTISLLGSLRKQLISIKEKALKLEEDGYKILAPKISGVKTNDNGFIIFENDVSENPVTIESNFIEDCLKSERIVVCNKDGYIGNTVAFEIGYLLANKKNVEFIEVPSESWIKDAVDYFSNLKDNKIIKKYIN